MGRCAVAFQVTRFKTLGVRRSSWEDNIKIDLQEVGRGGLNCIDLAEGRVRCWALVSALMNFRMPLNAGNYLICSGPDSFLGRTQFVKTLVDLCVSREANF